MKEEGKRFYCDIVYLDQTILSLHPHYPFITPSLPDMTESDDYDYKTLEAARRLVALVRTASAKSLPASSSSSSSSSSGSPINFLDQMDLTTSDARKLATSVARKVRTLPPTPLNTPSTISIADFDIFVLPTLSLSPFYCH